MTRLAICSYSFHRLLESGAQDMFRYIEDCKDLGATQLDPWNAHLAEIRARDDEIRARGELAGWQLTPAEKNYLAQVKAAALNANLPFGCIAVDGAHIYEADEHARLGNRAIAYRWLEVARILEAPQVRIDAGGPEEMPDDIFAIIVAGYNDLIARARNYNVEVLIENHWGPSRLPDNVVRLMEAVPGLGLLFDTNNWKPELREQAWERCARYARATHVKTFLFDENGEDPTMDLKKAMNLLIQAGYDGCWGVESVPKDGDEYEAVKKTFAFIRRTLSE
jgi:sugar phosphate isomerase/epimerase